MSALLHGGPQVARLGGQSRHNGRYCAPRGVHTVRVCCTSQAACYISVGPFAQLIMLPPVQAQLAGHSSLTPQTHHASELDSRVAKFQSLDGDDFRFEVDNHAQCATLLFWPESA